MDSLKSLLRKRKWTGKELGQLDLANFAHIYEKWLYGENPETLIDMGKFQDMVNSLTGREEIKAYKDYISIHDWIGIKMGIANNFKTKADFSLDILQIFINQFDVAEKVNNYISELPAIMTEAEYTQQLETDFKGNARALNNGAAVIKDPCKVELTESGAYKEPNLNSLVNGLSIEGFFPDSEDYEENNLIMEDLAESFIRACYALIGYNKQIDLVAEFTDVPKLSIFKIETTAWERLLYINKKLYNLCCNIYDSNSEKEIKDRKIDVLFTYFPMIDIENLEIPEENIAKALPMIEDFSAFTFKRQEFDDLFTVLPEDYIKQCKKVFFDPYDNNGEGAN